MKMHHKTFIASALGAALALAANLASAIPHLQLDIKGGTYNNTGPEGTPTTKETIVASGNPFTLYAYGLPGGDNGGDKQINDWLTRSFYVSMAIIPAGTAASTNFGSFTVGSARIDNSFANLRYGVPPVETYAGNAQDQDLPPHGIFPTSFIEVSFNFLGTEKAVPYNTQDNAGQSPTPPMLLTDSFMYFHAFEIDTSNLLEGFAVHFDLYATDAEMTCTNDRGTKTCVPANNGNLQILAKAPFSHDAESGIGDGGGSGRGRFGSVPEPATLALLGAGLMGMRLAPQRKARK